MYSTERRGGLFQAGQLAFFSAREHAERPALSHRQPAGVSEELGTARSTATVPAGSGGGKGRGSYLATGGRTPATGVQHRRSGWEGAMPRLRRALFVAG